jgi:hypothetical protein
MRSIATGVNAVNAANVSNDAPGTAIKLLLLGDNGGMSTPSNPYKRHRFPVQSKDSCDVTIVIF